MFGFVQDTDLTAPLELMERIVSMLTRMARGRERPSTSTSTTAVSACPRAPRSSCHDRGMRSRMDTSTSHDQAKRPRLVGRSR